MLGYSRGKVPLMWPIAAVMVAVSWGTYALSAEGRGDDTPLRLCVSLEPGVTASAMDFTRLIATAASDLKGSHARTLARERAAGNPAADVPFLIPIVKAGCPEGYVAPPPDRFRRGLPANGFAPPGDLGFNIFMFVVSDATADASLAGLEFARAPYKFSCADHVCQEIATALYIRAADVGNGTLLFKAVEAAAGLQAGYPDGHPPSEP